MSNPVSPEETIFNEVRLLSHPGERAAYLNDACGNDDALRGRIERLLRAEHQANGFLASDPLGFETGDKPLQPIGKPVDKTPCSAPGRRTPYLPMTAVAPVPGDVFEDYEILEKIGGNMGLVFKARHHLLDKVVALKLLPAESIADPARLARFQRELRIMGQLEHPNLVTAADARIVGAWHLVAMEFIDGVDLERQVEAQGAMPIAAACEAARQTAVALQYAHQHGLIHRDIKPSNLMVTHGGSIKVIDMGLALIQEESTAQLTRTGLLLGTMRYCAPEQFRDASRVDIRADIYSLGCTLYHLLTGKPPYGQRTTCAEVVQAHLNEPFPSLLEARPDAPAGLEAVLARMTAKDRDARFSTPHEVVEALAPFARGADLKQLVPPKPAQTSAKAPIPAKRATPAPATEAGPDGQPRKTRWKQILAVYIGIVRLKLIVTASILLLATVSAVLFGVTGCQPVVVLMDTTAPDGTYDEENKKIGASNAKEVSTALEAEGVAVTSRPEPLYAGWKREAAVISMNPDLVIVHRSSFHHSYNAVFNFGRTTNGFADPPDDPMWLFLYNQIGDDKLITLLGCIGNEVPRTRFLIYSRGTDKNWLSDDFRTQWVRKIEERFPKLKDRVSTMVIPNLYNGSFRQPETRGLLRTNVNIILGLPDKRQPASNTNVQPPRKPSR